MKLSQKIVVIALTATLLSGCANMTRREKGMVIGGATGAVAGSLLTNSPVGAIVGGAAGTAIGAAATSK